MKKGFKRDYPVADIRRFLEPGPVVLVSSAWKGERNIMTMGWHMPMEFSPSLVGCIISSANHSFAMIRKSKECVINVPTVDLAEAVIGIGNHTGAEIDKFETYGLTPLPAHAVAAPLIKECHVNLECRLVDSSLINKYGMFIFEVVKAWAAATPKNPKTLHYRGEGRFMIAGPSRSWRRQFRPENL